MTTAEALATSAIESLTEFARADICAHLGMAAANHFLLGSPVAPGPFRFAPGHWWGIGCESCSPARGEAVRCTLPALDGHVDDGRSFAMIWNIPAGTPITVFVEEAA